MGKERVCARNTTRNKSSRSTSSKTITSEADRIAAHLAAARIASSAQQKRREASVEIVIPVIPLVPLPIITNSRRICETSIVQDRETSIIQDQEFALNYSIVRDTFDNDASPLNVNISRSMEKVPTADTSAFYLQIVDGLKKCLGQNKSIYEAIHKIKASQDAFQKEINEKLNIISEKVDQLITPEDSYWKCRDVIKSRRCDRAKDIHASMFDVFGENHLMHINTTANSDTIRKFKRSHKTKEAFYCLFEVDDNKTLPYVEAIQKKAWEKKQLHDNALYRRFNVYLECLRNSKEITADITKDIRREELGDSYVSSGDDDIGSEGDVHSDKNIINQDESDKEQYENDGNIDQ
ncbi:unnamed protein product [Rhizophagus irregularis]|nr:unnamed protein product [Rhizophagus irregularis]